jgi:hypothetical protein
MKYFFLEPEVAGGVGERIVMDLKFHPPVVTRLVYEVDGWLGDALLEGFPCWIATEAAAEGIRSAQLTGVAFGEVEVTRSDQFNAMYPDRAMPRFVWLKIHGTPGNDDFGIPQESFVAAPGCLPTDWDFRLVVSERALNILKPYGIEHAEIQEFRPLPP